jgi:hypothetical protein
MRPEFVSQVEQLREKIFRKVKPKMMNGKQITGKMLLDLADAYTQAINSGSVPNIQTAWSYICQNECHRAIENSLNHYKQAMRSVIEETKNTFDQA